MNYTPGPWLWNWATDDSDNADGRIFTDPGNDHRMGFAYCVAVSPRYQKKEQWEADARLIAAAPDMLSALQSIADAIDDAELVEHSCCITFAMLNNARAAIAKATQ